MARNLEEDKTYIMAKSIVLGAIGHKDTIYSVPTISVDYQLYTLQERGIRYLTPHETGEQDTCSRQRLRHWRGESIQSR